jgi:uncharacterized protein YkwD
VPGRQVSEKRPKRVPRIGTNYCACVKALYMACTGECLCTEINERRAGNGKAKLRIINSGALKKCAQKEAHKNRDESNLGHYFPGCFGGMSASIVGMSSGCNAMVNAWMDSGRHKAIILDGTWDKMAGSCYGGGGFEWGAVFFAKD